MIVDGTELFENCDNYIRYGFEGPIIENWLFSYAMANGGKLTILYVFFDRQHTAFWQSQDDYWECNIDLEDAKLVE